MAHSSSLFVGMDLATFKTSAANELGWPKVHVAKFLRRDLEDRFHSGREVSELAMAALPLRGQPETFEVSKALKAAYRSVVATIVQAVQGRIGRFKHRA